MRIPLSLQELPQSKALVFALLMLFALALYFPSMHAGFMLDANYVIAQNPLIKQPALYPKILTSSFFNAFRDFSDLALSYYRPLTTLSFALDYRIWRLDPFGYRLTNIILHAFNSFFVYLLAGLLFRDKRFALVSALLFCALPVHEWVVNYIVGRGDVLQMFFSLLSLIAAVLFLHNRRAGALVGSAALFLCALLSREAALTLPLFIFFAGLYVTRSFKRATMVVMPFFAVAAVYYGMRSHLLPIAGTPVAAFFSPLGIIKGVAVALTYFFRYIVPWTVLSVLPAALRSAWVAGALFVLCAACAGWHCFRCGSATQRQQVLFGCGWLVAGSASFVITQRVIAYLGPYLSEHFLYFSSVGFVVVAAGVLFCCKTPRVRYAVFVAVLIFYSAVLFFNNRHWTTEARLMARCARIEHGAPSVCARVTSDYERDKDDIVRQINESQNPLSQSVGFRSLGNIYRAEGDYRQAIVSFKKAIEVNPGNINAYNNLVQTYLQVNEVTQAIFWLEKSLALDPEVAETNQLMGTALYHINRYDEAISYLKHACYYSPDDIMTELLLAMAYLFSHHEKEYQDTINSLYRRSTRSLFIFQFIADELYRHGYLDNAVRVLEQAVVIFPDDRELLTLLAASYGRLGREAEAVPIREKIQSLKPDSAPAP